MNIPKCYIKYKMKNNQIVCISDLNENCLKCSLLCVVGDVNEK